MSAGDLGSFMLALIRQSMANDYIFAVSDPNVGAVVMYPLALGGACILASIAGTFFVKLGASQNIMGALYKGFIASAVISAVLLWPVTSYVIGMEVPGQRSLFTRMSVQFYADVLAASDLWYRARTVRFESSGHRGSPCS